MPDYSERVRVIQRSSGGHGLTGEKSGSCEDQTRSVRWPAPLRASALKRANFSKRATWWSGLFKDVLSPVRFWVWLVSGASERYDCCLTCLGIQHAEEAQHQHCGDLSEVIWGLRRGLPQVEFLTSSTLQPAGVSMDRTGASAEWGTPPISTHFLRCSPWWRDVDRCIRGWALSLRGWRLGCVAHFGCGNVVRARPRDDSYVFPGRRECRARVESSTASQPFEVGRVVSLCGSRWEPRAPLRCHSFRKCMSPIVCLIGRIRRPTQGAGRGSSCGALVGIPISSVIRRDSEWPTERECLGYVCNPHSLKEGMETSHPAVTVAVPPLSGRVTGLAPQRKHD